MQIELSAEAAAAVQKWLDAGGLDDATHVVEYAVLTSEPDDFESGEIDRLVEDALAAGEASGWHGAEEIMPKARAIIANAAARQRQTTSGAS